MKNVVVNHAIVKSMEVIPKNTVPLYLSLHNEDGSAFGNDGAILAEPTGLFTIYHHGDSITAGNNGGGVDQRGRSYPMRTMLESQGRFQYLFNGGRPGWRISQLIEVLDTEVFPMNPDVIVLMAGANDISAQLPTADFMVGIQTYYDKCRAQGVQLVLCALTPRNSSDALRNATIRYSHAIYDFASRNGIPLIDYYSKLVDPATGLFAAGLSTDGTHPSSRGNALMGKVAADVLKTVVPPGMMRFPMDNVDTSNFISNPLNLGAFSPGPSGWTVGALPAGLSLSSVTDEQISGNWLSVGFTADFVSTQFLITSPISNTRVIPGHKYSLRGRIRGTGLRNNDSGNGVSIIVAAVWNGNDTTAYRARALNGTDYDIDNGVYEITFTAPSDAASLAVRFQILSNGGALRTGKVEFAQTGLYDLTTLGLL